MASPFFGMTTLGSGEPIRDSTAASQCYEFHQLSRDDYMAAFDKYLLGQCAIASTLEVDGNTHVLRAALGDMLRELLQRTPRKQELDAWFTALDFDRRWGVVPHALEPCNTALPHIRTRSPPALM